MIICSECKKEVEEETGYYYTDPSEILAEYGGTCPEEDEDIGIYPLCLECNVVITMKHKERQ